MRIIYSYNAEQKVFETKATQALIGRCKGEQTVDLDLSPDTQVSRPHARLSEEGGQLFVEDLHSSLGTYVGLKKLESGTKFPLCGGEILRLGHTLLRVLAPHENPNDLSISSMVAAETAQIRHIVDANSTAIFHSPSGDPSSSRLVAICELPVKFASVTDLETLLHSIAEALVSLVQGASHAAVLLKQGSDGNLVLRAHVPAASAAVSRSLARRALQQKEAFLWSAEVQPNQSQVRHGVVSSMYAAMSRRGEALGVVCVNSLTPTVMFSAADLQLLTGASHYAAIAIENCMIREELRKHAELTERLFSSRFPPSIRNRVIEEAGSGTLVSATRESSVTVLAADIRGFTEISARIGSRRMKDMLDQYFPAMVKALHEHGGTVERFAGDAIFAVFGSPEPDDRQYEHALKAAFRMQAAVGVLTSLRAAAGQETCSIGIGIHSGTALHGFIGNAEHMEFAVLGTAANLANRYCSAARPSEILLSPDFFAYVFDKVDCDSVTIQTKHEGEICAYRVLGWRD